MVVAELGPWAPLDVEAVVAKFSTASFRWWISGGRALDLHLGHGWRSHDDTDVGVARRDLDAVHSFLSDWELHIAAAGRLAPWRGEVLEGAKEQNNLWCRLTPDGPWVLDITIGDGTDENWVYRRDPSLQIPWDLAVMISPDGVPYLAPELQLLFKSKNVRPKDEIDAEHVIPRLDARQRARLRQLLNSDHAWQRLLQ